ncbi:type III pantothenate kinase [Rhodohalobacter sp. SW132]|uniref:type III pantothenate kinase n=1 Tax=Rhodohalobacter sp. SW132 TaxID=2293433 RepID=UPI000E24E662|nr:type III pantothenate kinase [Rhodohalobacter sp. SW132]REL33702.1 type III pantothenate kinase [Rhodohalobacter sp. SW132]
MIFIEAGNTAVKAVRVHPEKFDEIFRVETEQPALLKKEMQNLTDGEQILLSSVRKDMTEVINDTHNRLNVQQITYKNLGVVSLDYKTPETLGIDRVLACLGAATDAGGKDVIVIDSGTACTIDYMSGDFSFKGGVIMPGLAVYRKGMQQILPELPQTDHSLPDHFPGRSTEESLRWGVYGGFIYSIASFVEKYRKQNPSVKIYSAGGDGLKLSEDLRKRFSLSVNFRQELVFDGMRAYLSLNKEKEV